MALLVVEDMLGGNVHCGGYSFVVALFVIVGDIVFITVGDIFVIIVGGTADLDIVTSVVSMCVWVYMMYDLKQVT